LFDQVGASTVDMEWVQVHPTGMVNPKDPNNKVKWLAAEALRGEGGILVDSNGKRFCNELGTRDYVTGKMNENKGPFFLILNGKASKAIEWHCKHYVGRGIMTSHNSGADVAKRIGMHTIKIQTIKVFF
jgi:succinate dehydrogenase/fumarate reductase flavoprotein subunit